jgi:DNA helicase-2/ATP-dependent DNA helicase PcrA
MIDFSKLNDNQIEAVKWDRGSLLVLAGPGSGKTSVLTNRISYILEQSQGQHFCILALTYTNKAAAEMRARFEFKVPRVLTRLRITTLHSYSAELLRQHGRHIQIDRDFKILSNKFDCESLLNDVLIDLRKNFDNQLPVYYNGAYILPAITKLTESCIDPEKAENILIESKIDNANSLAKVYFAYKESLTKNNFLDYPSLISETINLINKFPFIGQHIRDVYEHILVDEFQDTNPQQYQLLSLIVKPDPSKIFVVADDDQIIYQWNGVSIKRLKQLLDDFNFSVIQLPENYRCPQIVVQLANNLIQNNSNRFGNKRLLKSVKQNYSHNVLFIKSFDTLQDESLWVANEIRKKSKEDREKCVVLARTKKILNTIGKTLLEADIPIYYGDRKDEFNSAPLRMLHSILRLINTYDISQSLACLSKSLYDISGIMIDTSSVMSRALADGKNALRAWNDEVIYNNTINNNIQEFFNKEIYLLLNSLNYLEFSKKFIIWAKSLTNSSLIDENSIADFDEECQAWDILVSEISNKFKGEVIGLHQFLHELDLYSKTPPKLSDAIPCLTIHASKGMEFGHVFLMALVEDQLPSWAAIKASLTKGDNCVEIQEERRNCFEAITRAQDSLTLTFSKQINGYAKKPSRFLSEMGFDLSVL